MKTHLISSQLFSILLAGLFAPSVIADCPPCGPDFCKNDPRYPVALSSKKKRLKQNGYPDYLITLLDKGSTCVARVERSPEGFSIQITEHNGNMTISSWSASDEKKAEQDLKEGKLKSYALFNTQHAFTCCGDPQYKERQDYDSTLKINKNLAIIKE